jgi:hypothetical protein
MKILLIRVFNAYRNPHNSTVICNIPFLTIRRLFTKKTTNILLSTVKYKAFKILNFTTHTPVHYGGHSVRRQYVVLCR